MEWFYRFWYIADNCFNNIYDDNSNKMVKRGLESG